MFRSKNAIPPSESGSIGVTEAGLEGTYNDVPSEVYYTEAVETLEKNGILKEYEDGNLDPGNMLTRAEATAVICRMSVVEKEAKIHNEKSLYRCCAVLLGAGDIAKATELGAIGGYGNGLFGPNDPVTQTQMLMYVRDMNLNGGARGKPPKALSGAYIGSFGEKRAV